MDPKTEFYKQLAENMSDMVALHAPDGVYRWVSPSAKRILGYSPEALIGLSPYTLFHPDDQESIRNDTHKRAINGQGNILVRYRIRHADGHYIWFESLTQPITDDNGAVVELHTTSRDVTDHQNLLDQLAQNEALYRAGVQSLEEGVMVFNTDGFLIAHNPQALDILGVPGETLTDAALMQVIDKAICADGTPCPVDAFPSRVTLNTGEARRKEVLGIEHPSHKGRRWLSINSRPVEGAVQRGANDAAVVVSCSDVTERIDRENQLELWSTVYQFSGEPIAIIDASGLIQETNDAFVQSLKGDKRHWIGQTVERLTRDGRSEKLFSTTIWPELEQKGHWRGELWVRDADGGVQTTWGAMTRVNSRMLSKTLYTLILSDISERINKEKTLRHRAAHDSLTGLPNRLLLSDRFSVALQAARRNKTTFACFYLDLDEFKPVNDQHGHAVGDEVLQAIAKRISSIVRPMDTIARIGGDEFVMLVVDLDSRAAYQELADRISQAVAKSITVGELTFSIGVSIGIAIYLDDGETLESLMSVSDQAMYKKKAHRPKQPPTAS